MAQIRIELHPVQAAFVDCKAHFKGFVGGRGCIAAETLINGVPVAEWTGGELPTLLGPAFSGESFLQGKADLYRVKTRAGNTVVVTESHRFLSPQGWCQLRDLGTGFSIAADDSETDLSDATQSIHSAYWDEISDVSFVKHGDFYDLTVPVFSHYKAHGLYHHNCGKSFIGTYDMLRRAKPGRLYMVVAPTYKTLKDATMRTFCEHGNRFGVIKKENLSDMKITLHNGAEILFRSADNPDSLRGPNLSGVLFDEASFCEEEAYKIAIACLREAGEQGFLSCTFTPKGKQHWTYKIFGRNEELRKDNNRRRAAGELINEEEDPNLALFVAKTSENPFLPPEFEAMMRKQYTSKMASQELEGSFLDVGGRMFNRTWFKQRLRASPAIARRVRYWDKAATADGGCFTCGTLMAATYDGLYYVEDVVRGQWSTFQREEMILATARRDAQIYNYQVRIWIEEEPGSGGKDSIRFTLQKLAGHPAFGHKPSKDKRVRAEPFAAQAEAGNVVIVDDTANRRWVEEWLDELESFPDGLADQVDSASGAFNKLTEGNVSQPATGGTSPGGGGGGGSRKTTAPGATAGQTILGALRSGAGVGQSGGLRGMPSGDGGFQGFPRGPASGGNGGLRA